MRTKVRDIMCASPQCCTPEATIQQAAAMMATCDCGAIPVIESNGVRRAVGVITDRDIACRAIAEGKGPETKVSECMSSPLAVIGDESSVAECCQRMEDAQVRRLMVVDADGELCGVVSQADIALHLSKEKTAHVVKEISKPASESPAA
jgi:CBS domain-containing protein